jgi:hypothetical protein
MDLLLKLVLVGIVVAGLWFVCRPQYLFVIRIENGAARVVHGKVPQPWLDEINEICRHSQVADGSIKGVRRHRRVALVFSRHIPPPCRQRFRNALSLYA